MTLQERTLVTICHVLEGGGIPYMVIGGLANAVWGEPRATLDIDITVWLPDAELPRLLDRLQADFQLLVTDPADFVAKTRVLPLKGSQGVGIDLIFGMLPFEEAAIRRAVPIRIQDHDVKFCTAEDLILMKIISDRERDISDARGITMRNLTNLDLEYLEPRIRELSTLLERKEIVALWENWKRNAEGQMKK